MKLRYFRQCLIELNLRKLKWLLFSTYHSPSQADDYCFSYVSNCLDTSILTYDQFLLVGEFNPEDSEETWLTLQDKHNAANFVKEKLVLKV